ncbi:MAG: DUF4956 domain-containing protein [Acidobacteria bacterium]|nr:DUF4956 domain-containing protein [Acidobacteriota bacterium]
MRNLRITLIVIISAATLIAAGYAVIYLASHSTLAGPTKPTAPVSTETGQPASENRPTVQNPTDNPFLSGIETNRIESTALKSFEIVVRLFLAVLLSGILAFRPRKNVPLFGRNLYVAQTQILLAVVAAALMLIVGDNTARAFAIFAAVSLVRFRTNIRDPKEITVLLISLALGLATGVGRWELGAILCVFALVLLWVLEFNEPEKVFRSMELTIKTRNTETTQDRLRKIFGRFKLASEIRQIDPPEDENSIGCIVYYLNLPLSLSTDYLSDRIFDVDADNVDGIEWEQKKGSSYVYQ